MGDETGPAYPPIGDYGIIGDGRTAALISRSGSLDWLCTPRFDGPSLFAALLDQHAGGRFQIQPTRRFHVERRYVENTNVLETRFTTGTGVLRLVDLMPVADEEEKREQPWPDHWLLRILECTEGEVDLEVVCNPRPDYGRAKPRMTARGALGFWFAHGSEVAVLQSEVPLEAVEGEPGVRGRVRLREGERRRVSLAITRGGPAVIPPLGTHADAVARRTVRWWQTWTDRCRYEGPYRSAVVRSVLTLKLLTYAPSGAVIAAPTTSLPEEIGGIRNWDYRYCWLRDASWTVRALLGLGYPDEAEVFLRWLLHATRLTQPELQMVYDVYGRTRLRERELVHLEGYASSRPVRIGNAASAQLQLDVYGEVVSAAYEFICHRGEIDRAETKLLVDLGKTVCERWREPDEGIWEIREERRHHTHSKALCWVALDRLIRLSESGRADIPADRFRREREAIRKEIEERGYSEELGSYVATVDRQDVDAALLQLGLNGYADPTGLRMRGTHRLIRERLGRGDLLLRYPPGSDGLSPGEGAFGLCSFWEVDYLARRGDVAAASRMFERMLSYANDLGLFAEEIDPGTGAALGNFPQAYTHIGVINAALTIADRAGSKGDTESQENVLGVEGGAGK